MQHSEKKLSVTWRGKTIILEMDQCAKLKDLGDRLQKLTGVKIDTLRLIVPVKKGSKLLYPFSDEHSNLPLESTLEGKSIMMMGVPENEVDEVLQSAKTDLRIAGFDEEETRMRQRSSYDRNSFVQLPQGTYIFSEFQALSIPGIELNPPASEALKLMHRLAADPGIVAIMNKHRWRVGIMTEMAPVGYVGVSPKCILGFNKNHGEEISLRLRTDDLKGFRKYESIKMTLLHELAHMVYSEHDANFYALDKQLNNEAAALDWTKSKGHTLGEIRPALHMEQEYGTNVSLTRKLGGEKSGFSTVRASSVAAAYRRFAETPINGVRALEVSEEPDLGSSTGLKTNFTVTDTGSLLQSIQVHEGQENEIEHHFDPHDSREAVEFSERQSQISIQLDLDCSEGLKTEENELQASDTLVVPSKDFETMEIDGNLDHPKAIAVEPDPDDSRAGDNCAKLKKMVPHEEASESLVLSDQPYREPDPDDSQGSMVMEELEPDHIGTEIGVVPINQSGELDPDDFELQKIQDPVKSVYSRMTKAIDRLRSEVDLLDVATVLQTLLKIIRNAIEHPDEPKFKKIRKANPTVQRNILRYGAAKEVLDVVGFYEEVVVDEMGRTETYLVLKRNDPGLLWLVKSSLESAI